MGVVRLTATLGAPVVMRDDLHLDGLFMAAHPACRSQPLARSSPPSEFREPPIPIARLTWEGVSVYLATVAQLPPEARLETEHHIKRRDEQDIEALAKPVHLGLGPAKNRMISLPIVVTPTISWLLLGEAKTVRRFAERTRQIGSWRAQGYGIVTAWRAEYVEDWCAAAPTVLVSGGRAQRHLPASWCTVGQPVVGAYRPPYWHPARQADPIIRAGDRCAIDPAILDAVRHLADPAVTREHKLAHQRRALARAIAEGKDNARVRQARAHEAYEAAKRAAQ